VKAAHGELVFIMDRTKEHLSVGDRTEVIDIYVSPAINGLIVGYDWLSWRDRIQLDFINHKIQLGNSGLLKLHDDVKSRCQRIYIEVDVELPPRQETIVPVRVSHQDRRDFWFVGVTENLKIPNFSKVYSGRSVLAASFSDLQICVTNTADRLQVLKKGNVEPADILVSAPLEPTSSTVNDADDYQDCLV